MYKPRRDGAASFAELLDAVACVDPEMRVRFTSPHPKDFSDDVLRVRNGPCGCQWCGVPVTSRCGWVCQCGCQWGLPAGVLPAPLVGAAGKFSTDALRRLPALALPKQVIAAHPNICKQLHMPAQSGSTAVLERMRRGYTREAYDELVAHVREALPEVALRWAGAGMGCGKQGRQGGG